MERLVILSKGDRIEVSDLPVYLLDWVEAKSAQRQSVENLAGGVSLEDSVHEVERISYSKLFNNAATTRRGQRAYWALAALPSVTSFPKFLPIIPCGQGRGRLKSN